MLSPPCPRPPTRDRLERGVAASRGARAPGPPERLQGALVASMAFSPPSGALPRDCARPGLAVRKAPRARMAAPQRCVVSYGALRAGPSEERVAPCAKSARW